MRVVPVLILAVAAFGAGAAVAGYLGQHRPAPAAAARARPSPAAPEGERDSKADLQGQMMWDPNTRTFQGG